MSPLASLPEPNFDLFKISSGIDYVRLFSLESKNLELHLPKSKIKYKFLRAGGHDGMLVTIHDPTVYDLIVITRELPDAVVDALEVYCDFTPRDKRMPLKERHDRIEDVRQWLISHLLPWQGAGIQPATRVSAGRGHSAPVFTPKIRRRAAPDEMMYFGHSDSKYADRTKPNLASMRLYKKATDDKSVLLPAEHRCRLEVTLNQFGCKHFGLTDPDSIFDFDFRDLGEYFRLVRPEIRRPPLSKRVRERHPLLAKYVEEMAMRTAEETLMLVGSHAASHEKLLNVDRLHRHAAGNKMIQKSLDDQSRRVKKRRDYVREWGSF
jgi:hypothetical protein